MATVRRVLVVGAGPSGLVSLKECRAAGIDAVCYDAQDGVGGLWRFTDQESHSSVYRSTVINTSKEMMCYSDFPPPKEFPNFMHHTHCLKYFEQYADHFGLRPHIRLRRRVLQVAPADDYATTGRYRVRSQEGGNPEVVEVFDAVIVCSGHHWRPKTPAFPGLATFQGRQMHSHSYKDYKGFENLNVLVVGVGNSGLDIAVELSRHAKQTYLSTRSGTWIATRQGYRGMPSDYSGITRHRHRAYRSVMLDGILEKQMTRRVDLRLYGLQPKHHVHQAHPSINDDLINRINTGSLAVRPNVREFRAHSVVFEDGREDAIDAVVFATGYDINFPFLEKACNIPVQANKVDLYKYVFPPDNAHPTLCVIGLFQAVGALMPISEVQARWAVAIFTGKLSLPSRAEMYADIEAKRKEIRERYVASERHTVQVDYPDYSDEIAGLIGCVPDVDRLRETDPELAEVVWSKGAVPAHYRLSGPGAWAGARDAIMGAEYRIVYALSGGRVPDFIVRRDGTPTPGPTSAPTTGSRL